MDGLGSLHRISPSTIYVQRLWILVAVFFEDICLFSGRIVINLWVPLTPGGSLW